MRLITQSQHTKVPLYLDACAVKGMSQKIHHVIKTNVDKKLAFNVLSFRNLKLPTSWYVGYNFGILMFFHVSSQT